jgi:hypothetical protein
MTKYLCYVLGCDPSISRPVIGARHRMYGNVVCCASHDPNRHGYGMPLVNAPVAAPQASAKATGPHVDGGTKVPVSRPAPIVPPATTARRF